MTVFQRIIVGVDGSEPADRALQFACMICVKLGARLSIVHATDAEMADAVTAHDVISQAREKAQACGLAETATTVVNGPPGNVLVDFASTHAADLIVTGKHGIGQSGCMPLGSTSQHIAERAKCLCLTVR